MSKKIKISLRNCYHVFKNAAKSFLERIKFIGPSVIVTGSVVGSGSIVMTPLLGAAAGFLLLWWLLLSMWSKPIIQAEISRYIVVTKKVTPNVTGFNPVFCFEKVYFKREFC